MTDEKLVEHHFDEKEGIHTFKFLKSSGLALDEWIAMMGDIFKDKEDTSTIRLFIDVRESGSLPIKYASTRAREWLRTLPPRAQVRVALLHPSDVLHPLVNAFTRILGVSRLTPRVFEEKDEEAALKWLKRD